MTPAHTAAIAARRASYALADLAPGDSIAFDAPTSADCKRIHRNVSQYGQRQDKAFRGRMNRQTRVITFTRIR